MRKKNLLMKCWLTLILLAIVSSPKAMSQTATLTHSYTFEDGTAKDVVGSADGTLMGSGSIADGAYTASANGDYIELPGADIAINTYSSITLEAYIYADVDNTGPDMTAYFGGTQNNLGVDGYWFTADRWEASRTAISCGVYESPWNDEDGVDGSPVSVGSKHYVVSVLTGTDIKFYIDGSLIGTTTLTGDNTISNLSNDLAYIAKGGYITDPTWMGTIYEFNIYEGELDAATIAQRGSDFVYGPGAYNNATLDTLYANIGMMDPSFDPATDMYNLSVPFGTASVHVTSIPAISGANVVMYDGLGNVYPADTIVNFTGDGIDLEIDVTALDGTTEKAYYLSVFVDQGASDATLSDIQFSAGAVDPVFNSATTDYTVIVPVGTTSVDVTGIPNYPEASVEGDGTITLTGGTATATITVTSQDASATKNYTVNFQEADGTNYALQLAGGDGPNSNIDISGLNLTTLPYTIEMWFKPDGDQPDYASLLMNPQGNNGISFVGWQTSYDALRLNASGGDQYAGPTVTQQVTANTWHHVVAIVTASSRTLILDGVAHQEVADFSPLDWTQGITQIGAWSGQPGRTFKGLIDEVRIWNDSISAETLDTNEYKVLTGNEPGLLAYYNFDLNNSAQAVDIANGHNGIISGGTYVESFPRADLSLSALTVNPGKIYPTVQPNTLEYMVVLPEGTTSMTISATPNDPAATITGTGSVDVSAGSGRVTFTVSSADQAYSQDYVVNYVTETPLTLTHSYTFADGTAKDVVGDADGTVHGGMISKGLYTASANGEYISLPAERIAINTYPSITVEAYLQDVDSTTSDANTMISYFGNTVGDYGTDYFFTSLKARTAISCLNPSSPWSSESGVTSISIIDDGLAHHIVSVLNNDSISFYVDGLFAGSDSTTDANKIFNLSNALAYLCKSGYVNDQTWRGQILEYNIYSGMMDAQTVASRAYDFPVEDSTTNATLSALMVDGDTINGFVSYSLAYIDTLAEGTTVIPAITATPTNPNATVEVTDAAELPGIATVLVTAEDGITQNTYTVHFMVASSASSDASLSDIMVDGTSIADFDAATMSYDVELAAGTTAVPAVTATATDANATVEVTDATGLPGSATILVTAEDGETTNTYTVNFTIASGGSSDATLSDIKVDGTSIDGFDAATVTYNIELPAGTTAVPVVTATATDVNATFEVTDATELPGSATILVTAEDGTSERTYTVNFTVATGVTDIKNASIMVYPTVSNRSFTVKTNHKSSIVTVYNMTGKVIKSQSFNTSENTISIPDPGLYILKVTSNNATKFFRVIKTK